MPAELLLNSGMARERNRVVEEAVRAEGRRLLDFIRRRVPTSEDAEDILQDVFTQLATSYRVTAPIERVSSWLFTVARNRITDWYRKRRPEPMPMITTEGGEVLGLQDILFDPNDGPDRAYARSLVWPALVEALEELPEEQREVFVWHELEGKSFKEIGDLTGENQNTLLSRKRYAVLHLRDRLRELYDQLQDF
jgi:RNA polymerase sigma factor (sigma-70 family)